MKTLQLVLLVLVVLLALATPALAQTPGAAQTTVGPGIGAGFGAGLTIIGAGWGFGRIGAAALESVARQPEVRGDIRTTMIIIAVLLEGATFFALIVCILVAFAAKTS